MACRIILSAPVPFPFLWTLDFRLLDLELGLGIGTWNWDLGLGLGLGLDNFILLNECLLRISSVVQLLFLFQFWVLKFSPATSVTSHSPSARLPGQSCGLLQSLGNPTYTISSYFSTFAKIYAAKITLSLCCGDGGVFS